MYAKITGINYTPLLCKELSAFNLTNLGKILAKSTVFILKADEERKFAVSRWVSPKRTRSYPYARIYDSLSFIGKKLTIIPILKDEGKKGDRDFLQWDTISLMNLLGIYVVISYYSGAKVSPKHKITTQTFHLSHIKKEIYKLLSYQSDALHWNLEQIDKVGKLGQKALRSYNCISKKTGIEMHSRSSAEKRVTRLLEDKNVFMNLSRELAKKAQMREAITMQPKEKLTGTKATITIKNYLGGYYFFTVDEVSIDKQNVYLIESKHTRTDELPKWGDIKDGLLKMILFTNLVDVKVDGKSYSSIIPVLKLTTGEDFRIESLNKSQIEMLNLLKKEAEVNGFQIFINERRF